MGHLETMEGNERKMPPGPSGSQHFSQSPALLVLWPPADVWGCGQWCLLRSVHLGCSQVVMAEGWYSRHRDNSVWDCSPSACTGQWDKSFSTTPYPNHDALSSAITPVWYNNETWRPERLLMAQVYVSRDMAATQTPPDSRAKVWASRLYWKVLNILYKFSFWLPLTRDLCSQEPL